MITEQDINMIIYFAEEKGDIERWSEWESRKEEIGKVYPELIPAIKAKVIAERTLQAIINSIKAEA